MRLLSTKAVADGHAAHLQYMNEDLTQSLLATPEVMSDVEWMRELVTKDGSMQSDAAATASGNATRDFLNGKTAFAIGGYWVLPDLKFQDGQVPSGPRKVPEVSFAAKLAGWGYLTVWTADRFRGARGCRLRIGAKPGTDVNRKSEMLLFRFRLG